MNWKRLLVIPLLLAMVLFGVGIYFLWGATAHKAGKEFGPTREKPVKAAFSVPGTIIASQDGNLYKLQGTSFTQLTDLTAQGAGEGWQQPEVLPSHQDIIAVKRSYNYSDLYELNLQGQVVAQLTNNQNSQVPLNQWAFFPEVTQDGSTLFYTYDEKEGPGFYQIDFSVYSMPITGGRTTPWTNPYSGPTSDIGNGDTGTGGALQAVPLPSGGIIMSEGTVTDAQQDIDQIWYLPSPMTAGNALTPDNESCYSPALSPDGTRLAMICSPVNGGATTSLEVATVSGSSIGTPQVVASGSMIASPTWSPNGQSLLYFNSTASQQLFEMEVLNVPKATATPTATPAPTPKKGHKATPTPAPTPTAVPTPQALTVGNDFLATSSATWF